MIQRQPSLLLSCSLVSLVRIMELSVLVMQFFYELKYSETPVTSRELTGPTALCCWMRPHSEFVLSVDGMWN